MLLESFFFCRKNLAMLSIDTNVDGYFTFALQNVFGLKVDEQ
jgi:hypothetical protein